MAKRTTAKNVIANAMTELELQRAVLELAKQLRWRVTHFRPARVRDDRWVTPIDGDPGFPDLCLARKGIVLFFELKAERGKLTTDQELWREAVGLGRHFVIRPTDWQSGLVERLLT